MKCYHLNAEKRYYLGLEDDWYCPDCKERPSRSEVERLREEHARLLSQNEQPQEEND